MKRLLAPLAVMVGLLSIIIFSASSSGAALIQNRGYTGAPSAGGGTEGNCGQCHNTGNFGEPDVDILISATLNGDAITTYTPGQTYFVTVNVSASNNPSAYGYQSLFLGPEANGIRPQAGTPQMPSEGSRITTLGTRLYAEHEEAVTSGVFNFEWVAPNTGTGEVNVYTVGNAVNLGTGRQGDNGSPTPTILTLSEAVLPLDLLTFSGEANKEVVALTWETANEENVSHFSIERKATNEWIVIGQQNSHELGGSNSYDFTDRAAPAGENVYRLKMEDWDGSFAYSPIVSVITGQASLAVYPNPATDFIAVQLNTDQASNVQILNASGAVVVSGSSADRLDVRALSPGVYYIESILAGNRLVEKFIKR